MRIAVFTPNAGDLFGQERVLRDSARLLRASGHQVFVITEKLAGTPDYCDELLQVDGASSLNQLTTPWRVRKFCDKVMAFLHQVQPDVVHFIDQFDYRLLKQIRRHYPVLLSVHSVAPTCPASARLIHKNQTCKKLGGWGCLRHMHQYGCLDSFRGLVRKLLVVDQFVRQRKYYLQADHVVAVSNYIRALLSENGWEESRISVVYNPLSAPKLQPLPHAPSGLISCVSRLQPLKGIDVLLKSLIHVKNQSWELWVCGEGSERGNLESLAKHLGLSDRVKFLGKVPYEKAMQIMLSSRCLVQANVAPESFGLAAAEAAMQGVPVIAANLPALNEILSDKYNSFFFPPGNEKALANAIDAVFTGEVLTKAKAEDINREFSEKYSPSKHLQGMLRAYDCCITHFHGSSNVSKACAV